MKHDRSHLFPLISILLLFSALSYGQAWSGILAPARATDWTQAGIPGGVPSRTTQCGSTLTSGASTATIQAAINACPAGQVVQFGSGTFTLTASIFANKGIVLRGNGPTITTINLGSSNILLSTAGTGGEGSYPGSLGSTNWTGGLTRGSTVLTLASTSGIHAGQNIVLDQRDAAWVYTTGVEGPCTSGNSCGRNESPLQFNGASTRAQPEMVHVVSVDGGTQITIAAPGVAFDHNSGLSPQAFYWNNGGNIQYAGLENMHVNANNNDFAVSMPFCDYCWVKNVWVDNLARSAVFFFWGYGDVVRDSYFTSALSGAPTQYGIELNTTTYSLIENNICYNITACLLPETDIGLVAAYNYSLNTVSGNLFASFSTHLSHNYLSLYEGDVADFVNYDNSWGSSSQNTVFRSRLWGKGTNKTNYRIPLGINAQQHYMNVVANIVGDPTYHTQYQCDNNNQLGTDNYEYDLGFYDGCLAGISVSYPYDTVSESSLMRWGNWDGVTWNANGHTNGVRYCTGSGAGNPACTASETASTDPTLPGLASPSTTFTASFYNGVTSAHASCGTGLPYWKNPATGKCPLYPPIGPEVACTTNCIANTANHAAMIPAQLCYANTAKDGNGFLTAFDANACYANDPSSNNGPPPPAGLAGSVH